MVSKPHSKIVAAIDIGTSKMAAAIGRMDYEGKLDLLGLCKEKAQGVRSGVITNIEKTVRSMERVMKDVSALARAERIVMVSVNLSGDRVIERTLYTGKITCQRPKEGITQEDVRRLTSDMYKIVDKPGWSILHVFPQNYQVDEQRESVSRLVGTVGKTLGADFNIITVRNTALTNLDKCLNRAKLQKEKLIFSPIAASHAVLSRGEKETGVCLVDMGAGVTDVAVFHDGTLKHTSVIPFGGQHVSRDIQQLVGLLPEQAEELKLKHGSATYEGIPDHHLDLPVLKNHPPKQVSLKHLAHIIQARMEEIVTLVHQEIKSLGKPLGAGIVLTGGVAQLKNLRDLFQRITGYVPRIGYPGDLVARPEKHKNVDDPSYATCIGLALATLVQGEGDEESMQGSSGGATPRKPAKHETNILKLIKGMFKDEDDSMD